MGNNKNGTCKEGFRVKNESIETVREAYNHISENTIISI